jgi:hypothetical protein
MESCPTGTRFCSVSPAGNVPLKAGRERRRLPTRRSAGADPEAPAKGLRNLDDPLRDEDSGSRL